MSTEMRWLLLPVLLLAGCDATQPRPANAQHEEDKPDFPRADRPVATIVSARWSTEEARDRLNEAEAVMNLAGIASGMTVADIGAGEGYYTIRLAQRVGPDGRVLAEDIIPEIRDALATRVARERLDNVSVRLGEPDDAKLPENSFDRVLMVHMYHEIAEPYAFLWNLRPSLRAGGRVVVVDAERRTQNHGTPPALLRCEFAAVGYRQVALQRMPSAGGYIAMFTPEGARPRPEDIKPCRLPGPTPTPSPSGNHRG
ncbi:ubiquinone biosynthesis methyltransferase UbiE [Sphingomonas sp. Leaf407]|uniref:class I SAM-dependent methyltransferase n=1 Tax=unclassified Sphingomonas TaxID=196159 RepID=UPI0006FD169A|nr:MULTISPECIES: methyltransferase domain-containing protein [unclassified Sphingomonas]KQN35687.1 ubiquinone biosynthesis methyltransferase UbiE [Sphingomonas sp. Leaf42]KQT26554.1 ubiquinone biosynthesis methyltransferase UbiE [Sphingomonas sp. Leaf407]